MFLIIFGSYSSGTQKKNHDPDKKRNPDSWLLGIQTSAVCCVLFLCIGNHVSISRHESWQKENVNSNSYSKPCLVVTKSQKHQHSWRWSQCHLSQDFLVRHCFLIRYIIIVTPYPNPPKKKRRYEIILENIFLIFWYNSCLNYPPPSSAGEGGSAGGSEYLLVMVRNARRRWPHQSETPHWSTYPYYVKKRSDNR